MEKNKTTEVLFGDRTPWRSDPVRFTGKSGCEIVKGTSPGYYRYAVDGVVSSKQVDAVQLVEWEMAELFSSTLITPFERGVEFSGAETVVRDISVADDVPSSSYVIERNGEISSVNIFYLVSEKLATPSVPMREAARRKVANLYESSNTPWLSDEIKFLPVANVKIAKGKEQGKYVVNKNSGYSMIYTAARLIADGYAVKDENMYAPYYEELVSVKKWTNKKRKALFELALKYAKEECGYDDGEGELSSLFDCVLFLERATDYGKKKTKSLFDWVNDIYKKEKEECSKKSDVVKGVNGLAALLTKNASDVIADVEELERGLDRMKKSSKIKTASNYNYSMFFAHARRKPQAGAKYVKNKRRYGKFIETLYQEDEYSNEKGVFTRSFTEAIPIVGLFDGDWWDRVCAIASGLEGRVSDLENASSSVALVAETIAASGERAASPIFATAALFLGKKTSSVKDDYDKEGLKKATELAKKAIKAVKKAKGAAEETLKIKECLDDKSALFEKVWKKVKSKKQKSPIMLFAKADRKPFPRDMVYRYGEFKLVYLSRDFVITRYSNKKSSCDTLLGRMEFWGAGNYYTVKDKKNGTDYGVFDEESLVYCGLAEWRIK